MPGKVYIQRLCRRWGLHRGWRKRLDRSKRDFLCCCTTCWIFFFLFSSIKRMVLASPRFANLVTLLCLTLNNRNFRIYTFLKISHRFTDKWRQGRVESGSYLQSVSVRLILNWECGESGSAQFPSELHEYPTAKHSAPGRLEQTGYL